MPHRLRRLLTLVISLALLLAAPLCPIGATPLRVFVSIAPQRTFLERIGGARVQVAVLVRGGQDPHGYEPSPRQIADLVQADVYVGIGVPFESAWLPRLRAVNPRMDVVDLRSGLGLPPLTEHDDAAEEEGALDPHIWTSPPLVRRMGLQIRDYLVRKDPAGSALYQTNYAAFAADLEALDREIRATLSGLKQRHFMVFHPAWGHFAAAYGLIQIPIEHLGKAPGAKTLGALIDQARALGLRVIFVQPLMAATTARMLAEAIGGRVEVLDPMAQDYFANLRQVAQAIARAQAP